MLYYNSNFIDISYLIKIKDNPHKSLASNGQEYFIWTNNGLIYCFIDALPSFDGLIRGWQLFSIYYI